jgi:hypothetical protein
MLYRGNSIEGSNPSLSASPVPRDRFFIGLIKVHLINVRIRSDG